jgi:regulator of protease activity HflC (stomatin/prohibitin superfamily)
MIEEIIVLIFVAILLFIFIVKGLALIHDDEVGILTKKMFGRKLPQGRIISREGEIGVQADIVMPRLLWRNPITWKIEKAPVVEIKPGEVGIVESIDGDPLPVGRLLGDAVECNSYQDAKKFLENGGKKGPQVEILRPGTYRINLKVFNVTKQPAIAIDEEKIGVVVAQDGTPLQPGFIIAPKPKDDETKPIHNFFQNGQAFINSEGSRGPQLDTLQPGEYYVNPLLFNVKISDIAEVPPGYVAVLRSNIGAELGSEERQRLPGKVPREPGFEQPIHERDEVVLTTDKNQRGIWKNPIAPGKYNLNPLAFTAYPVPTSAVTIDWAAGAELRAEHRIEGTMKNVVMGLAAKRPTSEDVDSEKAKEFFKFSQLRVTSKDGFQLDVDVRMIIRIEPQNAPFVIARFGSVANLIEQIVHPLIDSSFRNNAGEKKAIEFVQERSKLQHEALLKAREEFERYHVEAQNLLIAYIALDQNLLRTQTEKEIAVQQQEQYKQQANAEEQRIAVQEKKARADKQPEVIAAKLSIDIATDKAQSARREAEGIRDATKTKADGESYQKEMVGKAIAKAYNAQAEVIGRGNLAAIQLMEKVSEGQIRITPDFLVTGEGTTGNLFNAWLAQMVSIQAPKMKGEEKYKSPEKPENSPESEDNTSMSS